VLAFEPEELLGPSFQMSFAAVGALIAGSALWRPAHGDGASLGILLGALSKLWVWAAASIMTTALATAATAPFSAYHFHQFNPYGILGNAIAIPVIEFLVMPASIAGLLLLPFGLDAGIWWMTGQGVDFVLGFARSVASIDGARVPVVAFSPSVILIFAVGFLWLILWKSPLRMVGLPVIAMAAGFASASTIPDIWIDRRADTLAVRGPDGKLSIVGVKPSRFTVSNWLPAAGDTRLPGDSTLAGSARCDALGCTAQLGDGRSVALVREPQAFEEDCRRAAIIVTPLVAPAWCRATSKVFDYRTLAQHGSMLITLKGETLTLNATRDSRYDRPWWPALAAWPETPPANRTPSPQSDQ
jgi:competence protein ComEC